MNAASRLHATRFTLPAIRRMRRPAEFKRIYASGRRFSNEFFTANAQVNDLTWARLGMSIAARILRRAVDRNRIRRLIRESFRMHQQQLPSLDIVIGARAAAGTADRVRLRAALESLWQKIANSCAV
ncbi:MAG TPA: ribonuclease P protein component [Steroidobacteraceae bacterium]|jgi:ribonuclease P protein component|nr:ribonuclease P protein component [Steroidobacteraceae bacterium]